MQDVTSNAFTVICIVFIVGISLIFLLRKRRITFDMRFHYQEDRNGHTEELEDREVPLAERSKEDIRIERLPDAKETGRDIIP